MSWTAKQVPIASHRPLGVYYPGGSAVSSTAPALVARPRVAAPLGPSYPQAASNTSSEIRNVGNPFSTSSGYWTPRKQVFGQPMPSTNSIERQISDGSWHAVARPASCKASLDEAVQSASPHSVSFEPSSASPHSVSFEPSMDEGGFGKRAGESKAGEPQLHTPRSSSQTKARRCLKSPRHASASSFSSGVAPIPISPSASPANGKKASEQIRRTCSADPATGKSSVPGRAPSREPGSARCSSRSQRDGEDNRSPSRKSPLRGSGSYSPPRPKSPSEHSEASGFRKRRGEGRSSGGGPSSIILGGGNLTRTNVGSTESQGRLRNSQATSESQEPSKNLWSSPGEVPEYHYSRAGQGDRDSPGRLRSGQGPREGHLRRSQSAHGSADCQSNHSGQGSQSGQSIQNGHFFGAVVRHDRFAPRAGSPSAQGYNCSTPRLPGRQADKASGQDLFASPAARAVPNSFEAHNGGFPAERPSSLPAAFMQIGGEQVYTAGAAESGEVVPEQLLSYEELLVENRSLKRELAQARAELAVFHRWYGSNYPA